MLQRFKMGHNVHEPGKENPCGTEDKLRALQIAVQGLNRVGSQHKKLKLKRILLCMRSIEKQMEYRCVKPELKK